MFCLIRVNVFSMVVVIEPELFDQQARKNEASSIRSKPFMKEVQSIECFIVQCFRHERTTFQFITSGISASIANAVTLPSMHDFISIIIVHCLSTIECIQSKFSKYVFNWPTLQ
jgi:hypothetical protein